MDRELDCFVLMPFSNSASNERNDVYWIDFYNLFLKKAFEEPFIINDIDGMCKIRLSKHEGLNGYILDEIIPKLSRADLILVILTDLKANVVYELGIRHALSHGTLLACKRTNYDYHRILSNISGSFVIPYEDYDYTSFRDEISKIFKQKGLPVLWKDSKVKEGLDLLKRIEPVQSSIFTRLTHAFIYPNSFDIQILWMDNFSETVAPIIAFLLTKNCKVTFAVSTGHFMQYVHNFKYDIIISDMREGEDENEGIQLFASVTNNENLNKQTPFVIFAGPNSMKKYKAEAMNRGVVEKNLIEDPIALIKRLMQIFDIK